MEIPLGQGLVEDGLQDALPSQGVFEGIGTMGRGQAFVPGLDQGLVRDEDGFGGQRKGQHQSKHGEPPGCEEGRSRV